MIRLRDVAVAAGVSLGLVRLATPGVRPRPAEAPRRATTEMGPGTQILLLLGFTGGLALAIFLMVLMLRGFHAGPEPAPPPRPPRATQPPLLQAAPLDELAHLTEVQQARLHQWRWLTPAHTQAAVPIGRAMQLLQGHTLAPVAPP